VLAKASQLGSNEYKGLPRSLANGANHAKTQLSNEAGEELNGSPATRWSSFNKGKN